MHLKNDLVLLLQQRLGTAKIPFIEESKIIGFPILSKKKNVYQVILWKVLYSASEKLSP